ncbi:Hypothetical predicted protein [Octopus vulgaris]|uniref:Stabilizer of axonemal microtubules 2-like n=2 Tax=Octopus vulgaris TaxID=6645 RepID=A0AA36BQ22_OCTVU|nr:Hypothetical predicted protein [Octopus vulgaris]
MTLGTSSSSFDIWAEEIPDDANITQLCDCGHHKRKQKFQKNTPVISQRNNEKLPETNYSETYKAVQDPRPRSSKRPLLLPSNVLSSAMSFETHQRSEFKPYDKVERRKPIFIERVYEPPSEPFTYTTSYRNDFIPKKRIPAVLATLPKKPNIMESDVNKFETTTTKDDYKAWPPQITLPFHEISSSTDSIIFPNKEPLPESTTQDTYCGKIAPRLYPIKMAETVLRSQGNMDMKTTHQATFKPYTAQVRSKKDDYKSKSENGSNLGVNNHIKFDGKTHFQQAYPGFKERQPSPAKMVKPPQTSLKLSYDNRWCFETEQRAIYKGHDIQKHPVRQSFKKEPEKYVKPTVKVESLSSQKRDYCPINLRFPSNLRSKLVVPKSCLKSWGNTDAAFDGTTSNKEFFQKWTVRPRTQYRDPYESNNYVPPQTKFHSETTTRTTYTPKRHEETVSYRPSDELWQEKAPINQEMTTNYRSTFVKPKVKMCKAQVYLIQQKLKNQMKNNSQSQNSVILSMPSQKPRSIQKVQ